MHNPLKGVMKMRRTIRRPSNHRREAECSVRGILVLNDQRIGRLCDKDHIGDNLIDPIVEVLRKMQQELDEIDEQLRILNRGFDRFSRNQNQTHELMIKRSQLVEEMEQVRGFHQRLVNQWRKLEGMKPL